MGFQNFLLNQVFKFRFRCEFPPLCIAQAVKSCIAFTNSFRTCCGEFEIKSISVIMVCVQNSEVIQALLRQRRAQVRFQPVKHGKRRISFACRTGKDNKSLQSKDEVWCNVCKCLILLYILGDFGY